MKTPIQESRAEPQASADTKGRRVTIDLTAAAASEVDRLRALTGLTTADVFRYALSLFRIYVDAKQRGHELQIVDPSGSGRDIRIELPVAVLEVAKE
ncbi:MAG: hypothetical protein L0Y72_29695 [Gemmataceae bacterium]|nr:hypothetical protein [Gemmataceae bacterium]MCI0743221.1 hypothetical protein [Gemmataceae bacterium]